MNIALFYYDDFAEFEVAQVGLAFCNENLFSVALENREYRSSEKQRFLVDQTIDEVDMDSLDLLVIPGGSPESLFENQVLKKFIQTLALKGKKIAGICGGTQLMAAYGLLMGKKCTGNTTGIFPSDKSYKYFSDAILSEEYVVVDGNIITGQGQAFAEFAVELANQMGLYKNEKERTDDLNWLKNIR